MIKLYLDDVRSPPDDTWTVARTAEEARAILLAGPVECATLDHDLGPCPLCNVTEEGDEGLVVIESFPCSHLVTGYDLVKWMAEARVWPRFMPAVHSTNSTGGATAMRAHILRHWRKPAGSHRSALDTFGRAMRRHEKRARLLGHRNLAGTMAVVRETLDAAHDERWMREQAVEAREHGGAGGRRVAFFYGLAAAALARLRAAESAR